ncbi:MAG: TetR/AcrR family transcriptional regulator, partial [Acidobacteriaceae bacterium]|nr:TetR/AcrR family transcriptional regulator [Acidobacteriaceae bacterium]
MVAIPTARRIAAAAKRLLDQEGIEAVTMRRVAHSVGITPMAVYRHFPDRAGLLNALVDAGFEDLSLRLTTARLSGDIEKRLNKVLDIYLDHALQNPKLFELMFLRQHQGARCFTNDFKAGQSPTANVMTHLIQEGMEKGVFREDDVWEIAFEMGALLQGLLMLYFGRRMDMPVSRFRTFCRPAFSRYMHGMTSFEQPKKEPHSIETMPVRRACMALLILS